MSVPNAADSARQWIERDATDPYSGGYIGPLMQDLLGRIEALEQALHEVLDWTEPKVTARMALHRLDVFRRARVVLEISSPANDQDQHSGDANG